MRPESAGADRILPLVAAGTALSTGSGMICVVLATLPVDHTAAWLAFVGAVIVASMAAATAQWRQRVEMRHGRHMHDLGELRSLLDECAQVVARASRDLLEFANSLAHSRVGSAAPPGDSPRRVVFAEDTTIEISGPFKNLSEAEDRVLQSAEPLFGLYQRVLLRLGKNHSVSLALLDVQAIFATAPGTAREIDNLPLDTPERWQQIAAWQETTRDAHFTFLAACHYLVRSQVAGDSSL